MNAHAAWVTAAVILYVVGSLATIYIIGHERKPITPGEAVMTVLLNGTLALGLFLTL